MLHISMRINWLPKNTATSSDIQKLLDLEYKFRSKAIRILLAIGEDQDDFDLDHITFDFHTTDTVFFISKMTPQPIYGYLSELASNSVDSEIPWFCHTQTSL